HSMNAVLHPPHDCVLFFLPPSKLPVWCAQGQLKQADDRLSAGGFSRTLSPYTIRDDYSVGCILKSVARSIFINIAENSLEVSSITDHEIMIFVLFSNVSLIR